MPSNSKSTNREETNAYNGPRSTVYPEPWWNSAVYNPVSPGLMRENASDSSSLEQSVDGQSHSDGGINEEDDDAPEKSQSITPLHAGISSIFNVANDKIIMVIDRETRSGIFTFCERYQVIVLCCLPKIVLLNPFSEEQSHITTIHVKYGQAFSLTCKLY